jgi:hypothetical protein
MTTITFVVGIERFNAGAWGEVERRLAADGAKVRLRRYHDAHVDQADPALAADLLDSDVVFISLINMRPQADWLASQLEGRVRLREHARGHGAHQSRRAPVQREEG